MILSKSSEQNIKLSSCRARLTGRGCFAVAAAISAIVFAGWLLHFPSLIAPVVGNATMKFNTAFSILSCCGAWSLMPAERRTSKFLFTSLAWLVVATSILSLIEYLTGIDFRIDQLIVPDFGNQLGTSSPGRMGPNTALGLFFLSSSALAVEGPKNFRAATLLLFGSFAISTFSLVGYLYSVPSLYRISCCTEMAFSTSISMLILTVGCLSTIIHRTPLSMLLDGATGGVVARKLLPITLLAPPALGLVRLEIQRAGLFPTELGLTFMVITMMLSLTALVFLCAQKTSESERLADDKAAAERYAAVARNSVDAIVTVSSTGKIVACNPASETIFGFSGNELMNEPITKILRPDSEQLSMSDPQRPLQNTESTGFRKNRSSFPAEVSASGWQNNGEVFFTFTARDISDRKAAEKRLTEFYSVISHELRAPLTSISGALGIVTGGLTGTITQETEEMIKIASLNTARMLRLINELLDLRKIEEGKLDLRPSVTTPTEIVSKAVQSLHGMTTTAAVQIIEQVKTDEPISCDEDRIVQIIVNLLSNAIKFSPPGSRVIVIAETYSEGLIFSVSDEGPGISQEEENKLFKRFQQLSNADRQFTGSGLGLTISKSLVELHGGKIGFRNNPQSGSTFWFQLPFHFEQTSFGNK